VACLSGAHHEHGLSFLHYIGWAGFENKYHICSIFKFQMEGYDFKLRI
jgi:hypothetical protein